MLPACVVEGAARYLGSAEAPLELVPLLGVCRAWRLAVCPLFYRAALVAASGAHGLRTLAEAVAAGCQQHIVQLHVPLPAQAQAQAQAQALALALAVPAACGPLPAVRSLVFRASAAAGSPPGDAVAGSMPEDVVTSLLRLAPNARHMAAAEGAGPAAERVLSWACAASSGPRIAGVGLAGTCLDARFPAEALGSIALAGLDPPQPSVELVRRSAPTLERLHVGCAAASTAALLFVGGGRGPATLVYPRLRHLHIGRSTGDPPPALAPRNPLPRLETLHCFGRAPLPVALVLLEGRAQLRHVALTVDADLAARLRQDAESGTPFPGLGFVSLQADPGPAAGGRYLALLRLCPAVHTVRVLHMQGPGLLAPTPLCLPASVRRLDLGYRVLTLDQAVRVLCASPQLLAARLAASKSLGPPPHSLLSARALGSLRARHRTQGACVRSVELLVRCSESGPAAARFALALAAAVPSIAALRIAVRAGAEHSARAHIETRRRRYPYSRAAHLAGVRFTVNKEPAAAC
ncbi:hypothetical protein H4R18_001694 [Coemansia javaensis]|uniref:Uncharacterized protein n=1 Tax=Coemansia javaensis TaxID=2761396 RepID=A0A9W8HHA9_9FUNG|nr:hypothetical protein H4R18_001694 [Coemansia javaensis]